jgi:hypothetical protein
LRFGVFKTEFKSIPDWAWPQPAKWELEILKGNLIDLETVPEHRHFTSETYIHILLIKHYFLALKWIGQH